MASCRLCLVTDRVRLVRACAQELAGWRQVLLRQIEGAVRAGIDLVQIREPDLAARTLADFVTMALSITRHGATRLLVNDRLDVALARGADGVQLRESSPPPAALRSLVPPTWLLGQSVHDPEGSRRGAGADFFVAGTMFPTASKADTIRWLGPGGLTEIVEAAGEVPVLAIGGITAATAAGLGRTGAAGTASIGAFLPQRPNDDVVESVQVQADALRAAFDR